MPAWPPPWAPCPWLSIVLLLAIRCHPVAGCDDYLWPVGLQWWYRQLPHVWVGLRKSKWEARSKEQCGVLSISAPIFLSSCFNSQETSNKSELHTPPTKQHKYDISQSPILNKSVVMIMIFSNITVTAKTQHNKELPHETIELTKLKKRVPEWCVPQHQRWRQWRWLELSKEASLAQSVNVDFGCQDLMKTNCSDDTQFWKLSGQVAATSLSFCNITKQHMIIHKTSIALGLVHRSSLNQLSGYKKVENTGLQLQDIKAEIRY